MPSVVIESSPLAGGKPVTISFRREGQGPALVFLHGGWGYDIYPIDTAALSAAHTLVVPSRSGYGASSSLEAFPADFHYCAVIETLAVLDRLGIQRAVWWGHSDGAVIAALAAIHAPRRVDAVILEALHYFAAKPRSRSFFRRMALEPETFSEGIRHTLAVEHGDDRWSDTVRHDGQAWLDLARGAATDESDLYGGRLGEISRPALVIHGGRDPRTEPGEVESILGALPDAQLSFHADAGHCPHAEASGDAVTRTVLEFLGSLVDPGRPLRGREPAGTVRGMASTTTAIDVMIEIPTGSRNKYEYDHENHVIRLDRRLFTATAYPADYGFVPDTLSKDGDPLDALVLVADPTFPGCVVRARILGVFFMRDEAGLDAKLLTVLEHDPQWDDAEDIGDLPKHLLNEIEHFFSIYKDLEPEKHTEVMGFEGRDAALAELEACRKAYRAHIGEHRSKGRRAADA